ncbi:hypothetical protein ADUPG1_012353 [Aduncisulcus paluster]|uniref:Uncharacterized protein n=1 Tax=Aduncisulcus paluster TaxID=2918883 RepID=A0ABQ5JZ61_9EUKA|nr:hypothetical protein ADUPG1_012353 [Aduncisulcus paluster]
MAIEPSMDPLQRGKCPKYISRSALIRIVAAGEEILSHLPPQVFSKYIEAKECIIDTYEEEEDPINYSCVADISFIPPVGCPKFVQTEEVSVSSISKDDKEKDEPRTQYEDKYQLLLRNLVLIASDLKESVSIIPSEFRKSPSSDKAISVSSTSPLISLPDQPSLCDSLSIILSDISKSSSMISSSLKPIISKLRIDKSKYAKNTNLLKSKLHYIEEKYSSLNSKYKTLGAKCAKVENQKDHFKKQYDIKESELERVKCDIIEKDAKIKELLEAMKEMGSKIQQKMSRMKDLYKKEIERLKIDLTSKIGFIKTCIDKLKHFEKKSISQEALIRSLQIQAQIESSLHL